MLPFKIMFRIVQIVFLTLIIMYFNNIVKGQVQGEKIPIGVVFDQNTEEIQNAFKFAMVQHSNPNRTRLDFQLYVDIINTADAFKLSRLICNQFGRGVIAMLGAVTPDSFDTLHSYTNTFQMPFVTPWFPEKVIPPSSGLIDYAVSMRPDYHKAVIDTITFYGWKNVIYIYDSHDGLLRLQQLYQSLQPGNATFRISNVKRVTNATDVVEFLGAIERLDRWTNKYVVLDSSTQLAKDALILHVRNIQLGRRNYHYFLSGLVMDDRWEKEVTEFGAINITGFRVLDFSRKVVRDFIDVWKKDSVSAQAALMYDAVQVLVDAILRLLRKKPDILRGTMRRNANINASRVIDCNPKGKITPYEHGDKISRMIKKTEIDGLTGVIRFNEEGHRRNFTLQIMEMTVEGDMIKVATWYDDRGLVPAIPKLQPLNIPGIYDRNKTYIVSTIEEPPYIMRESDFEAGPNDPYKGFCVDLAKMLADKLEIKYELRLVKDGKYGNENPKIVGGWDGMIGELIRKEADISVAPLTVTLEREAVVDFSKPFLSFDIKPSKKVTKDSGAIFSFLHPLSKEIWLCVIFSVFAVSVVLFLVSRFSPYEWRVVSYSDTPSSEQADVSSNKTTVVNEFSFWNSMWFSLGSFMQQGSDITPRSFSGRIVGSVWWFFTLIMISSYTANLASYLTLARISEPTQSYGKIATCPEDTINARGIAVPQDDTGDDHGWLAYLLDRSATSTTAINNKPCEMLVTITNSGVKDFAVAMPKGSKLRDGVNLALQSLKNDGELQSLIRKWFTKAECDLADDDLKGTELTLSQMAGLFYVLVGGLAIAMAMALMEFCQHGRQEAARANVPLRAALTAKARLASRVERKSLPQRTPQREHDRLPWNGGAFAGQYYAPANQINQEETALHASFTQV
ncbi:glutamate receptor 1-like isoform X1 [Pectinophora gossypiella]|uniref:glutamate receptor 1-like isoform X1 n=1 Tax=Pectinophora gossypiella TaxID=13191 RepID=UPI00214E79A5|nr:glutamate receptor 1-like isoform X1 [Pectinophora gossypiella]